MKQFLCLFLRIKIKKKEEGDKKKMEVCERYPITVGVCRSDSELKRGHSFSGV
jgi:hypothetical protein